jgi:hypothetical protein
VVAAGQQTQALRGLIQHFGFRQNAAADRHNSVGGQDEGAGEGADDQTGDNGQGGDEQTNPGGDEAGSGDTGSTDEQPVVEPDSENVQVCHMTGNGSYRLVTANAAGIYNGHYDDHDDIIPAFTYKGQNYGPQGDLRILGTGCK